MIQLFASSFAIISSASSISEKKRDICVENCIGCSLTSKYSMLGFSMIFIPESCTLDRNPKRTLVSIKFQRQLKKFSSVKNTGWPEVFSSPLKVVTSEYRMMDNK
ncbi:hypothetical protein RhiirA4_451646 [Rhizophagus irregularis]|uniref:Uncharacterized protein n=1 Tax=Rhizophagus irregularis TaxID=588596 RepID=A0A2I1FW63_9GLOM|nr:hypothetical protein RhiirA4_451646 [Rhizophagus irregularis]